MLRGARSQQTRPSLGFQFHQDGSGVFKGLDAQEKVFPCNCHCRLAGVGERVTKRTHTSPSQEHDSLTWPQKYSIGFSWVEPVGGAMVPTGQETWPWLGAVGQDVPSSPVTRVNLSVGGRPKSWEPKQEMDHCMEFSCGLD